MKSEQRFAPTDWALILGASSGFGRGCAVELARRGMQIFGVHLDRQATMPAVEETIREIKGAGAAAVFFNINAADAAKRNETLDAIEARISKEAPGTVKALFHSLAFGTLRPFIAENLDEVMSQSQMEMTLDVMANSLVYWTQGLLKRGLMRRGGRIFAMTSSGGHSVLPHYGAVSAAKAALESHIRQLAMELGPSGITANAILAGVTNTPALRKIPGAVSMLEIARAKNPQMRVTEPDDVARAVALLCAEDSYFISGNVIGVDAGEDKVSYVGQKTGGPIN